MRFAAALCIVALPAMAAMQPVKEVTSQAYFAPTKALPGFYQGYLFSVDTHNHFTLYAPDGHLVFDKYVQPDLATAVFSVAVDSNGTVAASWYSANGGRAGIDLMDASGKQLGSFDTGAYLPHHIAFADDHTIWSFGWQRDLTRPGYPASDYLALRHYSSDGRELGAWLPRSLFPKGLEPACLGWQEQGIKVTKDRIGLLACSGETSDNPEWVELDLNGNLTGRWHTGAAQILRVALTSDGNVYTQDNRAKVHQVLRLDRASGTFQPVSWTLPGMLYGADGDELVFAAWGVNPGRLDWYNQP